jgi:hypothetical protein
MVRIRPCRARVPARGSVMASVRSLTVRQLRCIERGRMSTVGLQRVRRVQKKRKCSILVSEAPIVEN